MTHEELLKLAPDVIETTANALKRVIDFQQGRGAMLRSLHLDPQVMRIANQLRMPPA